MSDWPDGFIWGTASSSTQAEGAAPGSDWHRWEQDGRVPPSGVGNGFANRHAEDFALYAEHGLTHHRLSLEWARLEPRQGQHDDGEVERLLLDYGATDGPRAGPSPDDADVGPSPDSGKPTTTS